MSHNQNKTNQLFLAAIELPEQQRDAYLKKACDGDELLQQEIKALIQNADLAAVFFEQFEDQLLETQLNELEDYGARGVRLGSYEIEHMLSQGGMGSVFVAQRADGQFERTVIIKMLPMDLQLEQLQEKFKSEVKLLARLQHPNIAQLHDAGVTEDSQPYFVMEYVRGRQIVEYCNANQLTIKQRLALFLELLQAIQFAHQNLIVHQDIKPSNILVSNEGSVKLLDFGIASTLVDSSGSSAVRGGDYSSVYVTPEQLTNSAITTATDTHQLGQLLFELLTGTAPSEINLSFTKVGQLPLKSWLDQLLSDSPQEINEIAKRCNMSQSAYCNRLAGDLDAIVSHAMHENVAERYASTELFAGDIRAMLTHYPVTAREGSVFYRIKKLLRRNRLLVAGLGLLMLVAVMFSSLMAWQAKEIAVERDKALQVMDLLVEVFETASPTKFPGQDLTASEILERGTKHVSDQLVDQPDVQAALLEVIARTQQNLGNYSEAQQAFEAAMELRQQTARLESVDVARLLLFLGDNQRLLAHYSLAVEQLEQGQKILRQLPGDHRDLIADALGKLGRVKVLQGELVEARLVLQKAADMQRELVGEKHIAYAQALNDLASVGFAEGKFSEVELLLRQELDIREALSDSGQKRDPDYATNINNLGLALFRQGKLEQSEPLFRHAVILREQIYVEPHPEQAQSLTNLGLLLDAQGNSDEALVFLQQALDIRLLIFGEKHMRVAQSHNNLGMLYLSQAKFAEALQRYSAALPIIEDALGAEHSAMATLLSNMAHSNLELGNIDLAQEQYLQSLHIRRQTLPAGHLFLSYSQIGLGRTYTAKGQGDTAVEFINQGLTLRQEKLPADHWLIGEAQFALAEALVVKGDDERALKLARSALAILTEKKGREYYLTRRATAYLGN